MTDSPARPIEYERLQPGRGQSRLIRVGALTAVIADSLLLASIYIWLGGEIGRPDVKPPIPVLWAKPIAAASVLFGLVGIFTSGVGLKRPCPVAWKVLAALASCSYIIGVVCVVIFGLRGAI